MGKLKEMVGRSVESFYLWLFSYLPQHILAINFNPPQKSFFFEKPNRER